VFDVSRVSNRHKVALAIFRVTCLGAMILAALLALWIDPWDGGALATGDPPFASSIVPWSAAGFGLVFSTGLFAQLVQHSVRLSSRVW
jgi:hypothetical protein